MTTEEIPINVSDEKMATAANEESVNEASMVVEEIEKSESATVEATESKDETDVSTEEAEVSVDMLTRKLEQTTIKSEENWDLFVRQKAETENIRRRLERDIEKAHKYGLEKLASELLPIKDSMELGLDAAEKPETDIAAMKEGMVLTLKMLSSTLEKFGIIEINPQDQKFDPHLHEAMAMQPVPSVEDGTVVLVHQKGYQIHERLLRPARVIVAKNPKTEQPAQAENTA